MKSGESDGRCSLTKVGRGGILEGQEKNTAMQSSQLKLAMLEGQEGVDVPEAH